MLIAEDLLLLLYDDETGKPITASPGLDYALAGAVLIELTMLGRIDVEDGRKARLVVRDAAPTGDPVLDERLDLLTAKQGAKSASVIDKLSKNLRQSLLARLANRGILQANKDKVLGLFPVTRWPAQDAGHELQVRAGLASALKLGMPPDTRTAALIALLHALNIVPKVIEPADKKALERRAKEIAEADWAADAVRHAVQSVQAAVVVTLAASVATSTAGAAGS